MHQWPRLSEDLMRRLWPYVGACLALLACGRSDTPHLETWVIIDEATSAAPPEEAVTCGQSVCAPGSFCSDRGFCASSGPLTCPGTCAANASCGPFLPGCQQNGCAVNHPWPVEVQKFIQLFVLPENQGCDLDGDGETDNELGSVFHLVPGAEARLRESVETGKTNILLHRDGQKAALWFGRLAEESKRCNPAQEEAFCRYTVNPVSFETAGDNATCHAWATVSSPNENDSILSAAQEHATAQLLPLEDSVMLLKLARPRLTATRTAGTHGDRYQNGMMCMALLPGQLRLALPALNPEVLEDLGGLAQAQLLFDSLVRPDLDLDGDGRKESLSVALGFETARASVRGLTPEK